MTAYGSLVRGIIIGTAVGVLYARKPGIEMRDDVRSWFQRISDFIPMRVKMAAGFGAAKGAGRELYGESKRKVRSNLG